jgi:hypothetical protein
MSTTLTAFYDLAVGPVSFDFVVFLTKARMAQARLALARLHVVIVPYAGGVGGMFRDKSQFYDAHEARWRLHNIVIPACALAGATHTLATGWDQARLLAGRHCFPHDWDKQTLKDRRHLVGEIIRDANNGQPVPRLSASPHALRMVKQFSNTPWVTLTTRTTYLRERNSDINAWVDAERRITKVGYRVMWLQDTTEALRQGYGYGELNLDLRMACYQSASLNLQANNGAASLCWFGDAPYRMFGAGVPAEEWDGLFVRQGLPLGASWPWAGPQQRICYGKETAERIIAEFDSWKASQ